MTMMRERLAERIKEQETDKVRREIKMAQMIKNKQERQKDMMNASATVTSKGFGNFGSQSSDKAEQWKRCLDKA